MKHIVQDNNNKDEFKPGKVIKTHKQSERENVGWEEAANQRQHA